MTPGRSVRFTIPGPPVPKQSFKAYVDKSGRVRGYTPTQVKAYAHHVHWHALEAMRIANLRPMLEGELTFRAAIWMHDLRVRDEDNVLKNVADGMQGACYANDKQIREKSVDVWLDRKTPRVEVLLYEGRLGHWSLFEEHDVLL